MRYAGQYIADIFFPAGGQTA